MTVEADPAETEIAAIVSAATAAVPGATATRKAATVQAAVPCSYTTLSLLSPLPPDEEA